MNADVKDVLGGAKMYSLEEAKKAAEGKKLAKRNTGSKCSHYYSIQSGIH